MSLSPLLVDSYRRYKLGTDTFVQWLTDTAKTTGKVDDILHLQSDNATLTGTGRLKGKDRVRSKNKKREYKVPVSSFVSLAEAIVATKKNEIPATILDILQDVVRVRKECAAWYRSQNDGASEATNERDESHRYIISQLEEVYELLLPASEKRTAKKSGENNDENTPAESSNRFSSLTMDECEDDDESLSAVVDAPKTKKPSSSPSYKADESCEDISLAVYLFMKDITDIRIFVRRTWREYKHGNITLNSASITMNTAISVVRRINAAFMEQFPQFQTHQAVKNHLFTQYTSKQKSKDSPETEHGCDGYDGDDVHLSIGSFVCMNTFTAMSIFFGDMSKGVVLHKDMSKEGIDKVHQDDVVLWGCLNVLNIMAYTLRNEDIKKLGRNRIMEDQVIQAMAVIQETRAIPTWAVMAVQMLVDTRRELGPDVTRGWSDLRKETDWVLDTMKACQADWKNGRDKYGYCHIQDRVNSLIEGITSLYKKDLVYNMMKGAVGPRDRSEPGFGEYFLFKNHPMICGLLLKLSLIDHHILGTEPGGDLSSIRSVIYLYQAFLLSGQLPKSSTWPDLEYLIAMYGESRLFVGQRPKKYLECYRRLMICLGVPILDLKPTKRRAHKFRSTWGKEHKNNQPRLLTHVSRYVQLSFDCSRQYAKATHAAYDPSIMLEMMVNKVLDAKDLARPVDPYNTKKTKVGHQRTFIRSLRIFKEALKEDDFPLRFEFLSLNRRCQILLRQIRDMCVEKCPMMYPAFEFPQNKDIHVVVTRLLEDVASYNGDDSIWFKTACTLLNNVMTQEGNVECLKAQAKRDIKLKTAVDPKDDPEDFDNPRDGYRKVNVEALAKMVARAQRNGKQGVLMRIPLSKISAHILSSYQPQLPSF